MTHDPLDLQQQEAERELQQERERLAARVEKDDLIWLMQTKRGRRIVARLMGQSGPYRSVFHTNAATMAFQEGWRNFSVALVDKLTAHCFDLYLQMLKEQAEND